MKTITTYCLTTMLLVALTTWAFAQSNNPMRSPAAQQAKRDAMKRMLNSFWSGEGSIFMATGLLKQDDFREGIGLSEEQNQKIQDAMSNVNVNMILQNDPNFKPFHEEMSKLITEQDHPFVLKDASEETIEKFFEIQGRMQAKMQ